MRFQNTKGAEEVLLHSHEGTCVVEFSSVIGCWENSYHLFLVTEVITVLYHLVSTTNQVDIVGLTKKSCDITTKIVAAASLWLCPSSGCYCRVRPEKVTNETLIRYLSRSFNRSNLVNFSHVRRKPSMHTKDFLFHKSSNW